jgi:hypothetical protein
MPSVPALLILGWALLLAAWVVGNPPFAAPDESDHYIRAVGISEGHVIGKPDPGARIGVTPTQVAWTAQEARLVAIPRGLDPQPFSCELGPGQRSAACLRTADPHPPAATRVTAVGNYQPLPYLLPALLLRGGSSPPAALRLGRLGEALIALLLLAVAAVALYDAASPVLSVTGLLLAVTPMVVFCAAILSGSALEVAGALAFFACLLRVMRPGPMPTGWWVATGASGAVLALGRSTSPVWLVLLLAIAATWAGPRAFASRCTQGWPARLAAGAVVLAVVVNRVWDGIYGTHVSLDTSRLHAGLVGGVHEWWRALPELVGKFGYLEVKLPLVIPIAWFALVGAILVAAMAAASLRERLTLAVAVIGGLTLPVVFFALIIRRTGGGLQGRHVLAMLIAVPLLAGEALYRNRARLPVGLLARLTIGVPLAVAAMQVCAWYVNAKRYAVGGSGPIWFLDSAAWSPPLGWWLLLAVAVLAGGCLAALAVDRAHATGVVSFARCR